MACLGLFLASLLLQIQKVSGFFNEKADEFRGLWPNTKDHSKVVLEPTDADKDMTLGALLGRGGPQVGIHSRARLQLQLQRSASSSSVLAVNADPSTQQLQRSVVSAATSSLVGGGVGGNNGSGSGGGHLGGPQQKRYLTAVGQPDPPTPHPLKSLFG